jgi:peptidoglycan/xylan/chitin deacetylase (PgdA/CDA1 family)
MQFRFLIDDGPARDVFARHLARDAEVARLSLRFRLYYLLARPLLPLWVRQRLQGSRRMVVSDEWCFSEAFFDELTNSLLHEPSRPLIHPWPGGADFAFVLTHDVESAEGVRHMLRVADVEEALGLRSSFNLVPYKYPIDQGIVAELTARGFEIGIHGYNHDGRLYYSRGVFQRRAKAINEALRRYGAVGFRSPMVHRNLEWLQALEIEYDASCFDRDPYQAMPGGVGSLWPFIAGKFVELPYTLPQDHTVWIARGEIGFATWERKLRYVAERNGMALMLTHPDYMLSPERLDGYAAFLAQVRDESQPWYALPYEVARWWRDRDASHIHRQSDGALAIVGPAGTRAVPATIDIADGGFALERYERVAIGSSAFHDGVAASK